MTCIVQQKKRICIALFKEQTKTLFIKGSFVPGFVEIDTGNRKYKGLQCILSDSMAMSCTHTKEDDNVENCQICNDDYHYYTGM